MKSLFQLPLATDRPVCEPACKPRAASGRSTAPDDIDQSPFAQWLARAQKARKPEEDPERVALAWLSAQNPAPVQPPQQPQVTGNAAAAGGSIQTGPPDGSLPVLLGMVAAQALAGETAGVGASASASPLPAEFAQALQDLQAAGELDAADDASVSTAAQRSLVANQPPLALQTEPSKVLEDTLDHTPTQTTTSPAELQVSQPGVDMPVKMAYTAETAGELVVEAATSPVKDSANVTDSAEAIQAPNQEDAGVQISGSTHMGVEKLNSFEPARTAEAHSSEIVHQVVSQIDTLVKTGKSGLRLQLYPQELGRIDLHIANRADGLHVWMAAAQPETGAALQRSLDDLRGSLAQLGLNLAQLNVSHNGVGGSASGASQGQQQRPSTPFRGGELSPETSDQDGLMARRMVTSQFDYQI